MAVSVFLANSPPLHSFLGGYGGPLLKRVGPLRPCLSNVPLVSRSPSASAEVLGPPTWRRRRKKKRVEFADSRGLALAVVHVFNEAEDNLLSELQFHMSELEGASELRLVPSRGEPSQEERVSEPLDPLRLQPVSLLQVQKTAVPT